MDPSKNLVAKSVCCCSMNIESKMIGWGTQCEICPPTNTSEYFLLCPHGSGRDNSGAGIS